VTGRVLRRLGRWVERLYAAPGPSVDCEAYGGPCDGRTWRLPGRPAPVWLASPDGARHLYVPRGDRGPAIRYVHVTGEVVSSWSGYDAMWR
jgi:hypothetical protein